MASANLGLKARARLGTTLRGKYTLESVLGVGGMAIVFRARHRNTAQFAIKMLLPEHASDDEIRTRFLREGYAANSVKHPGVVGIVDDDVSEDGAPFLVMELLDGHSVEDLLSRHGGRVPVSIATTVGIDVLDVLTAAHAAGVVHRDIKPANLFVTRRGVLKVLDFGIARVRDAAARGATATQTGVSFGTPAFMAPEQARGRTKEVGERADVWAVGASMFSMITGRLVHEGETGQEILIKLATVPATSISQVAPSTPAPVASVIDRALRFERADRWAGAAEMRAALLQAAEACFGDLETQHRALATFCVSAPEPSVVVDDKTTRKKGAPEYLAPTVLEETARAVSGEQPKKATRSGRGALVLTAAAGVVVVGTVATLVATMQNGERRPSFATSTTPSPTPSAAPAASSPAPSSAAPERSADVASVRVDELPPSPTSPKLPPPKVDKPSAPAVQERDDCKPNYWLDDAGAKHWKPQCF